MKSKSKLKPTHGPRPRNWAPAGGVSAIREIVQKKKMSPKKFWEYVNNLPRVL